MGEFIRGVRQTILYSFVLVLQNISIYFYATTFFITLVETDNKKQPGKYAIIALTGLLTSTLDAVAAMISGHKMPAATIFKPVIRNAHRSNTSSISSPLSAVLPQFAECFYNHLPDLRGLCDFGKLVNPVSLYII